MRAVRISNLVLCELVFTDGPSFYLLLCVVQQQRCQPGHLQRSQLQVQTSIPQSLLSVCEQK